MAALGALIERARSYDDIANEVRSFISRIVGPSLELMGTSIELLKLEGLIETVNDNDKGDASLLQLSPQVYKNSRSISDQILNLGGQN